MNSYEQYLSNQRIIPDKKIPFFLHWVKRCYNHCKKPTSAILGQDEIDAFLGSVHCRFARIFELHPAQTLASAPANP